MKRIRLATLFKRHPFIGYGPRSPWAAANRKHQWSPLAQELIARHISDASDMRRERKGWAEAKQLRPDWRVDA